MSQVTASPAGWSTAYIGLGSNLASPQDQLTQALNALSAAEDIRHVQPSRFFRSKAVGPGDQPDYINAVARLETQLTPPDLLSLLQGIEAQQGRVRLEVWGPRTLDLDLLLYNSSQIKTEKLTVPHPRIAERNFVVVPLADLAPDLVLPDGSSITSLAEKLGMTNLKPLD